MALTLLVVATAAAAETPAARLDRFEARLDGVESATQALASWCADHRLADPPVIHADRVLGQDKPADAAVRRALAAAADEPIGYRRVRLRCGAHVLSEADNWYRPARLTAEMNRTLETTDTPFGLVVRPLGFHRRTLTVERLVDGSAAPSRPDTPVIRHRAVLETADGAPLSLVVETYTAEVLAGDGP